LHKLATQTFKRNIQTQKGLHERQTIKASILGECSFENPQETKKKQQHTQNKKKSKKWIDMKRMGNDQEKLKLHCKRTKP